MINNKATVKTNGALTKRWPAVLFLVFFTFFTVSTGLCFSAAEDDCIIGDTPLDYAVQTNPAPLQASPEGGNPNIASMTIVISNPHEKPVCIEYIDFTISEGPNPQDLTTDAASIESSLSNTKDWYITHQQTTFTLSPTGTGKITTSDSVVIYLKNIKVNDQVGTTPLIIKEKQKNKDEKQKTINLSKFPNGFKIDYFRANPTEVEPGGSTTLSWKGSEGANYTLTGGEKPYNGKPTDSHEEKNLQDDTTFTLEVTKTEGSENIEIQRQVKVTVLRAKISGFIGPKDPVCIGQEIEFKWHTVNADRCELYADNRCIDKSAPLNTDNYKVKVEHSQTNKTTYHLYAYHKTTPEHAEFTINIGQWKHIVADSLSVGMFQDNPLFPYKPAVSPDGRWVFVPGFSEIDVIDVTQEPKVVDIVKIDWFSFNQSPLVSPDGRWVYVANWREKKSLAVIDTTQKPMMVVKQINVGINPWKPSLSPDGKWIYLLHFTRPDEINNILSVVSTGDMSVRDIPVGKHLTDLVVSRPDGRWLYVADREASAIIVIDATTMEPLDPPINVDRQPLSMAVSPNGKWLVVAHFTVERILSVIDTTQRPMKLDKVLVGSCPQLPEFSPDGKRVFIGNYEDGTISVVDTTHSPMKVDTVKVAEGESMLIPVVSPDGRSVYVASQRYKTLSVIDTTKNPMAVSTIQMKNKPQSLVVSLDNRWVLVAENIEGEGKGNISVITLTCRMDESKTTKKTK